MRPARLPCRLLKGCASGVVPFAWRTRTIAERSVGCAGSFLRGGGDERFQPGAEPGKLAPLRLEHLAVELDQDAAVGAQVVGGPGEQPAVVVEAVTRREHG